MPSNMKEQAYFRVSSRMPLLLGDELIPDPGYAVFELVKNAYDADASEAIVRIINPDDLEQAKIIVSDDGHGMTREEIENSWLVIGTPNRRSLKKSGRVSEELRRPFLGEKGIGRFAAHKLGDHIRLITRAKGDEEELVVTINWGDFDPDEPQFIDKIPVSIFSRKPKTFFYDVHGTRIIIKKLRETWSRGMIRRLHRDITSISSPFDAPGDFRASLNVEPDYDWTEDLFSHEKIRQLAQFEAACRIVGPDFSLRYTMRRIHGLEKRLEPRTIDAKEPFPHLDDDKINQSSGHDSQLTDNEDPRQFTSKELEYLDKIGEIRLRLYMFDLTHELVRMILPHDSRGLKNYLKLNGGIRVYRGGIRVFGLGGEGEDWLDLGGRRVQLPVARLSNNQIVGAVTLEPGSSRFLREQTNRRGFVKDAAYQALCKALRYVITQIEAERIKDKSRIKTLLDDRKFHVPVIDELSDIREILRKLPLEHSEMLLRPLQRVEKAYEETRDMLLTAASSGLSIGAVVHDVEKQVKNLAKAVRKEPLPVEDVRRLVVDLDKTMTGLTYLLRQSPSKMESARELVEHALFNVAHRFRHHQIKLDNGFSRLPDFKISCSRRFVVNSIMNILDNSMYWLGVRGSDVKKIYIGPSTDVELAPAIIIADTGPGFKDPPEDLTKPFFTRKPDGMGLGLYLADQTMQLQGGRLEFPDVGDLDLPRCYDGAVVALVFSSEAK